MCASYDIVGQIIIIIFKTEFVCVLLFVLATACFDKFYMTCSSSVLSSACSLSLEINYRQ